MNTIFLMSSDHFLIMLNVSPVGNGTVIVEAKVMTVLISSSMMSFANIFYFFADLGSFIEFLAV